MLIHSGLIVILPKEQTIKLDNIISGVATVQFEVPQGPILGPLLFNIYVNDISNYISDCTLIQYADDTQVLHQGHLENLHAIIKLPETTLKKTKTYFLHNSLMLKSSVSS